MSGAEVKNDWSCISILVSLCNMNNCDFTFIFLSMELHSVMTQKAIIYIFIAVKNSNLSKERFVPQKETKKPCPVRCKEGLVVAR
jgi:hypothetical protein